MIQIAKKKPEKTKAVQKSERLIHLEKTKEEFRNIMDKEKRYMMIGVLPKPIKVQGRKMLVMMPALISEGLKPAEMAEGLVMLMQQNQTMYMAFRLALNLFDIQRDVDNILMAGRAMMPINKIMDLQPGKKDINYMG